jgi:hypothetical protein
LVKKLAQIGFVNFKFQQIHLDKSFRDGVILKPQVDLTFMESMRHDAHLVNGHSSQRSIKLFL